jgi:hypothetical protein
LAICEAPTKAEAHLSAVLPDDPTYYFPENYSGEDQSRPKREKK